MDEIHLAIALPPAELSPNARAHWGAKAKATKAYRDQAYMETILAGGRDRKWSKAEAEAVFYWPDHRRRDLGNADASLKAAWDGMVDAGLLVDDRAEVLSHLPSKFRISKDRPRVEIHLFRAG